MFYCNECAEKNGYPQSIIRSVGPCECCGNVRDCSDMPSSELPKPEEKLDKHIEIGTLLSPPAEGKPIESTLCEDIKNSEVEKIAWQIFLSRTGLRFKRELTSDEKKQISNVEAFKVYREQAERIYAKKQQAVFKKKYPVIKVPASGKRTWMGGARCLYFVYSKNKGNFILEGYVEEVEKYLKENYTHYFYYRSLWNCGMQRGSWYFWKKNVGIFEPSKLHKTWKYQIRPYSSGLYWREGEEEEVEKNSVWLKRMPHRWIPEFDKF